MLIQNYLISGENMVEIKKRVFFDTNILVDVLVGNSRPSFKASLELFHAARKGLFEAFITTQSIIDAEFICRRSPGSRYMEFPLLMLNIMSFVNIIYIHAFSVEKALKNPSGDFEDDTQWFQANFEDLDVFVTSDRHLLARKNGEGPLIITPEGLVEKMT